MGAGWGEGWSGHAGARGAALATPCPSEALPSLGEAGGWNGPLIVLVGSRGEGAREPGPWPSCHLKVKEFWVSSAVELGRDPQGVP